MGFIIFGLAIGSFESIQASVVYIIIYIIIICGFAVILSLQLTRAMIVEINGLSRENPVMGITLGLVFLSMAGIPPLAGFLGKWLILLSGISSGYNVISVMIVVASVIGGGGVLCEGYADNICRTFCILGFLTFKIEYLSILVPGGVPLILAPFLVIIETLSYMLRAISLGVRLDISAGHLLFAILSGFVFNLLFNGYLIL